jgi:glycosyltransferase involved in cell wall biosynthesis
MLATDIHQSRAELTADARLRRFDKVVLSSVWGDPLEPRTWSGAPFRLGRALKEHGVEVSGFQPTMSRLATLGFAARHMVDRHGQLVTNEQIRRGAPARRHHAMQVATMAARSGARHILHFGTFDLPPCDLLKSVKHYIYCDQTWWLSLRYRTDILAMTEDACEAYEELERAAFRSAEHIFTFGDYVRDDIVDHYGIPASRVTVVGSGMGEIAPYLGPKSYEAPRLLFVAKHLFTEKGGDLLLEAFPKALRARPDLTLTIVGDRKSAAKVRRHPAISFQTGLSWDDLTALYRRATLLVQPMLNDPWGQVYLEALISRTPVMGLNRNGLPEILENGRHGFLIEEPDSDALAGAIVDAVSDSNRLAHMGQTGQQHVLKTYSWNSTAERIAFV